MAASRNAHVGKSSYEKNAYFRGLRTPVPANPTYLKHEENTTDSVQENDKITESAIQQQHLKPYDRQGKINLRDFLIVTIGTVVGGALLYFLIDISRDIGILSERSDFIKQRIEVLQNDIRSINKEIQLHNIEFEVMKRINQTAKEAVNTAPND